MKNIKNGIVNRFALSSQYNSFKTVKLENSKNLVQPMKLSIKSMYWVQAIIKLN